MPTFTASEVRANPHELTEETLRSRKPVVITSEKGNVVPLPEEDWNAVTETLHLLSVPEMRKSIHKGIETDALKLSETMYW